MISPGEGPLEGEPPVLPDADAAVPLTTDPEGTPVQEVLAVVKDTLIRLETAPAPTQKEGPDHNRFDAHC